MSDEFAKQYQADCAAVLDELGRTLASIDPASLERLADEVLKAEQVFFVGVGRVLLSLQSVCKRLAHLGIKTHYVGEITEPAITKKDLGVRFGCVSVSFRHREKSPKHGGL